VWLRSPRPEARARFTCPLRLGFPSAEGAALEQSFRFRSIPFSIEAIDALNQGHSVCQRSHGVRGKKPLWANLRHPPALAHGQKVFYTTR